jgi:hypothetical protein
MAPLSVIYSVRVTQRLLIPGQHLVRRPLHSRQVMRDNASFVVILARFSGFPVQARRFVQSPLHLGGDARRAQPHYRIIRIDLHPGLSSSLLKMCVASGIP